MDSNRSIKKKKKEAPAVPIGLQFVSQTTLNEIVELSKLIQDSLTLRNWKQIREMWTEWQQSQMSIFRYLQEINVGAMWMTLSQARVAELLRLRQAIEASNIFYKEYIDSIRSFYQSIEPQTLLETSRILTLAHANSILSFVTSIDQKAKRKIRISREQIRVQEEIEDYIDQLLEKVNPDFVIMRAGAWSTFASDNPDRLRQSVASARELLNHVLRSFVPEEKTRKERIRTIVSENEKHEKEASFISSIANYVDTLYTLLSKVEHTVYKDPTFVEMALKATEDVLVVLLKKGLSKFPVVRR